MRAMTWMVLAAGLSRRMGKAKLLLPLEGGLPSVPVFGYPLTVGMLASAKSAEASRSAVSPPPAGAATAAIR